MILTHAQIIQNMHVLAPFFGPLGDPPPNFCVIVHCRPSFIFRVSFKSVPLWESAAYNQKTLPRPPKVALLQYWLFGPINNIITFTMIRDNLAHVAAQLW